MSVWGRLGAWCYSMRQIPTFICNILQGKSEIDHYIDIFKVGGVPLTEGHRYKNPNVSSSIGLDLELQTHQPTPNSLAIRLIRANSRSCLLDPVLLPPSSERLDLLLPCWNALLPWEGVGREGFLEGRGK